MRCKNFIKEKNDIIERMGVYLETHDSMAPLEARIFSTLMLTGKDGITFEQLVKDLNASKSTVCVHLNTLQTVGRAKYYTKPGDRKRYFTIIPNRLIQVMNEMLQKWNEQKKLHEDILNLKLTFKEVDSENDVFDIQFHKDYLQFLTEVSLSVEKFKQKINQKSLENDK